MYKTICKDDRANKSCRPSLASLSLISLTPSDPWLRVKTSAFDSILDKAVADLKNDFTSGARQLADKAIGHLAGLSDTIACVVPSWSDYWGLLVFAAKRLSKARPSMSAPIKACLLRILERIARRWDDKEVQDDKKGLSELALLAQRTFDETIRQRSQLGVQVGTQFVKWLLDHYGEVNPFHPFSISN